MNISTRKTVGNHDMRESFERFTESEFPHMSLIRKGDTREYLYKTTQFAYAAWQAATAQSVQYAEPVAFIEDSELEALREGMNIVYVRREDDRPGCTPLYTQTQPAVPDELMREMSNALRLAVFSDDPLIKSDAMAAVTKYNNWRGN